MTMTAILILVIITKEKTRMTTRPRRKRDSPKLAATWETFLKKVPEIGAKAQNKTKTVLETFALYLHFSLNP